MRKKKEGAYPTHTNTAGKRIRRERHFEPEFVDSLLETTLAAEDDLVLEQGGQTVPQVFRAPTAPAWTEKPHIGRDVPRGHGVLEDFDIAMETDNEMCDANRTDDGQDHSARDGVAGEIRPPRIVGFDVVIGDAAIALTELGAKPRQ